MAGVVLENLSWKKLIILGIVLGLVLVAAFLVGGIIAPKPSNVMILTGTKCLAKLHDNFNTSWYNPHECEAIDDISPTSKEIISKNITANQIVFSFFIPYIRERKQLKMSPWFQNLIGVLSFEVKHDPIQQHKSGELRLHVKLGYRDHSKSKWTLYAISEEDRDLECVIQKDAPLGTHLNCSILALFELGSISHPYYLVNIKLPVDEHSTKNMELGPIEDIELVVIHQNGGFTKVWLSIKSIMFPVILAALIWFWRRVQQLTRSPILLEKMLFALGLTLSLLNAPIEFVSIYANAPYMTLVVDIRQGIFYAMLMAFWIIFAGEHTMDESGAKGIVGYWKHLSAVGLGSICLFIFDMCERGVKLKNPFFSMWVTTVGRNVAFTFIVLAMISACCYFVFLCYMIFRVFRNIRAKKSALPSMSQARKLYYSGLIYRFNFLMVATLVCAAATVVFFSISQVMDSQGLWDEPEVQYTSAVFVGVYCMWNVYVFGLLSLYAPSHKNKPGEGNLMVTDDAGTPMSSLIPTVSETTNLVSPQSMEMSNVSLLLSKVGQD